MAAGGPRAQMLVGISVRYSNGCRLNHAAADGLDTVLPPDHGSVAFIDQTFGQKVPF